MALEKVAFGSTGLQVSRIGLGAGKIGSPNLSDADAEKLLNTALDSGINLIDIPEHIGANPGILQQPPSVHALMTGQKQLAG